MKAGDKVVCVDDGRGRNRHSTAFKTRPLRKGMVYVVSSVINNHRRGKLMLNLVGVPAQWHTRFNEPWGWASERFRLVSEVGHPPVALERPTPQPAPRL